MESKNEEKMINLLQEIKERLTAGSWFSFRGPVADPGPEWDPPHFPYPFPRYPFRLPHGGGDPAPEYFLNKDQLAKIKVKELDHLISQLKFDLDILETKRTLIATEYKI